MTEMELDGVYTALCRAMGDADDKRVAGFLARFALLAMLEIDDPQRLRELIERAARQQE